MICFRLARMEPCIFASGWNVDVVMTTSTLKTFGKFLLVRRADHEPWVPQTPGTTLETTPRNRQGRACRSQQRELSTMCTYKALYAWVSEGWGRSFTRGTTASSSKQKACTHTHTHKHTHTHTHTHKHDAVPGVKRNQSGSTSFCGAVFPTDCPDTGEEG